MHMIACFGIFLLGGVAFLIIMRLLLFHFWGPSPRRTGDDQYLKRIADSLQ
jgi:hypothetical protein